MNTEMHDQGIDLVDELSSAELEENNSHSLLFVDIILKYDASSTLARSLPMILLKDVRLATQQVVQNITTWP